MNKTLELILILFIAVVSFVLGVKYSPAVKSHATWMFENNQEVQLPDLSDTQNPEVNDENSESGKATDQATPPAEDQNIVPSVDGSASEEKDEGDVSTQKPQSKDQEKPKLKTNSAK